MSPNIQPEPPLAQLEATTTCPKGEGSRSFHFPRVSVMLKCPCFLPGQYPASSASASGKGREARSCEQVWKHILEPSTPGGDDHYCSRSAGVQQPHG